MIHVYNPNTARHPLSFEVRRVQNNGKSLLVSIPKQFVNKFNILPGDLLKFKLHATEAGKLVIEKIPLGEDIPSSKGNGNNNKTG